MPKNINNGRVTSALQRAFGFKGRYMPLLDEVIVPVYQISDPNPSSPSKLCVGFHEEQPAATPLTESPFLFFNNPANSGILATVSQVSVGTFAALPGPVKTVKVALTFGRDFGGSPPSVGNTRFRDLRNTSGKGGNSLPELPACRIQGGPDPYKPVTEIVAEVFVKTDEMLREMISSPTSGVRQPGVVLPPDAGLQFSFSLPKNVGDTDDLPLQFNISWLETPLYQTSPDGGLP